MECPCRSIAEQLVGSLPRPCGGAGGIARGGHEFFTHRAQAARRRLRHLLSIGRISVLVAMVFLAVAVGLGDFVASAMKGQRLGQMLREDLMICGWVARWRPLEILLYGWWPIRTEARLYDR